MGLLDIVIVVIVGYNMFVGLRKGLFRILCDIVSLAAAIFAALKYYPVAATMVQDVLPLSVGHASLLGFILVWAAVYFVFTIFGLIITKVLSFSFFGDLNHLGGLLAGLLKGFVFVLPILIPLKMFNVSWYQDSLIARPLDPIVQQLTQKIPFEKLKKKMNIMKTLPSQAIEKIPAKKIKSGFDLLDQENNNGSPGAQSQRRQQKEYQESVPIGDMSDMLEKLNSGKIDPKQLMNKLNAYQ